MNACVVIPVLNEERQLVASVERVCDTLLHGWPGPFQVLIADNGSTDDTPRLARSLAARLPAVQTLRLARPGRGGALRTAWQQSEADVLAYLDVDLSTDLRHLGPLLALVAEQRCEVAIGSRLAPGAMVTRGWRREVISRTYNWLLRSTLGLRCHDAQCGFKALSRSAAARLLPRIRDEGWFFDTELLFQAECLGLRVRELPVHWVDDPDSRVRLLPTIWADLRGIARLRSQQRRNRRGTPRPALR